MPTLTSHPITENDHHFVLPDGTVITIPYSTCRSMADAADRVNPMLKALGIGHPNGFPEYMWAAIGFEGKCYLVFDGAATPSSYRY